MKLIVCCRIREVILATNSRGLFVVNGFQFGALSDTMTETTAVTAAFVVADVQVDFRFGLQRGQEGRTALSCFDQQMFEIEEDGLVVGFVDEGRGQSFVRTTARTTDSMDVIFDVVRHIVVDDVLDIREVKTLRGHVGSNQNVFYSLPVSFDCSRTLFLVYKGDIDCYMNPTNNVKY